MMDILIALILAVMLIPLLLLIAIIIRIMLGSPVFYRQVRPGFKGKPFVLYKFRTMTNNLGHDWNLRSDDERLTPIGRFLRKLSLDELPELFNVLKGDMSLVGPRPLLMKYLDRYSAEQARRHEIKPGITGLAQINGRNAITWEDKFKFDVWYVDNWSLWLDIKIILMTIHKVVKGEGINQPGRATMEEFIGGK